MNYEKIYYVYCYYDNHKIPKYIGKGKYKRLYDHIRYAKNSKKNSHFLNWIRKYIRENNENPIVEIIQDNLSNEEALELEKKFIKEIGRYDKEKGTLLNSTDGGDGGCGRIVTDEERVLRSKFWKKYYIVEENLKNHIERMKKRVLSEEMKKRISNTLKGNVLSEETRLKIGNALKGKYVGEKNSMYGKKHTEETKRIIGEKSRLNWQRKEFRDKINIHGIKNPNAKYIYSFYINNNEYKNIDDIIKFCKDKTELNPKSIRITFSNKKVNEITYMGWKIKRELINKGE